jgi:hypothetical protein
MEQQQRQEWGRWNSSLLSQLSGCAEGQASYDPYDSSSVSLRVTLRVASDGQLMADPIVRVAGEDVGVPGEPRHPEIVAFFKNCAPYPPAPPSRPTLLGPDGSLLLTLRLPLERKS